MYISIGFLLITLHMTSIIIVRGPRLPISSCSMKRSFSIYNNILDENRQNLSEDSLKRLNMMYFNGN